MDTTINNAIGLLEECYINGNQGIVALETWFLSERNLIFQTANELRQMEKENKTDKADKINSIIDTEKKDIVGNRM